MTILGGSGAAAGLKALGGVGIETGVGGAGAGDCANADDAARTIRIAAILIAYLTDICMNNKRNTAFLM